MMSRKARLSFIRFIVPVFFVLSLGVSACGGKQLEGSQPSSSEAAGSDTVVIGGANFTEMLIMQSMYDQLLKKAGYTTKVVTADSREIYLPELSSGSIDVVPEYAATLLETLNKKENGVDADTLASSDVDATMAALTPLAQNSNITVLSPAKAASQNAFVVTKTFAEEKGISTLSDFAALKLDVTLAAGPECLERKFCGKGLRDMYGINIVDVKPTNFGTPATKQAVVAGEADMGLVGTTDGTLDGLGLVVLTDDKGLQAADNLVPAISKDVADQEKLTTALNALAGVLTTEDLARLNAQVDGERQTSDNVAEAYLREKGLI